MNKFISFQTTRYSELIKRILQTYNRDITVWINTCPHSNDSIPQLLSEWCTNRNIMSTADFIVVRDGEILFSFHDHPSDFTASITEIPFIEKLAEEKISKNENSTS